MSAPATDWLAGASAPAANPGGRPAKGHKGRQRKLCCPDCGFIAYATAGAVERAGGLPSCACGGAMIVPNLRDRAAIEWDALEAELVSYGRDAYDAAMRELGYGGMVEPRTAPRRSGAAQQRCQGPGCHKFTAGRYCPSCEQGRPEMAPAHRRAA
jgi:hypothetical protein